MSTTSTAGPLPPDISRGHDLVVVCWVTLSLALLLTSLRFHIRGIIRKNLGWDDYLILLSIVFAIAQSVFVTLQVQSGFGRNIQYLTTSQVQRFLLYTNVYILLQTVGTALVRISVCLFVLRLVPATQISYRRWIWGLLIFNALVTIAVFLAFCLQCIPLSALWDPSVKARCIQRAEMTKIAQFQGGAAAITDFLCVLLPMMLFRTLRVRKRDKVAIFFILGLGLFTAATAVARTALLDLASNNFTWDNVPVAIWACLEQNIAISVASMPALRQLLAIRKKQHSSHSSELLIQHDHNARAHLNSLRRLSYNDCIYTKRGSLVIPGMISQPFWSDRKISLAETLEMSRVSPTPTFVDRKPSAAETLRLSMVTPSWGGDHHHKTSSTDNNSSNKNSKRLSIVSPLSVEKPPPLFSVGKVQQLGRFKETGLRNSRVATEEEIMTLGNPAAMLGYSCEIEGGTPKTSPKSPKFRNL